MCNTQIIIFINRSSEMHDVKIKIAYYLKAKFKKIKTYRHLKPKRSIKLIINEIRLSKLSSILILIEFKE